MERPHYPTDELLSYLDRNRDVVDVAAMDQHVLACTVCSAEIDDLRSFTALLSDPVVWSMAAKHIPADPSVGNSIRAETVIRRLVAMAISKFDADPKRSLSLLNRAETLVAILEADRQPHWLTEVWKSRGNAFRMRGEYERALAATFTAQAIAESHGGGGFDLAQVLYTRGTILFKMGRYAEAQASARDAGERFSEFGDLRRVAHAETLAAAALTEQGEVAGACATYEALLGRVQALGDEDAVARVTANMAVCQYRLRRFAEAREHAVLARWKFIQRQMEAERLRVEWVLAMIDVATGVVGAEGRVRVVASAYEQLGMRAESGFVELSLVEEYLRLGAWEDAEAGARRAVQAFAETGAQVHFVRALDFLERAIEARSATPDLVTYVQAYLRADDPTRVFAPPSAA